MKSFDKTESTNWRKTTSPMRERNSVGVALTRYNDAQWEILLIRKRYTYAYFLFALSRYNANSNKEQLELLNKMTIEEKNILLSLNFSMIWYHVWLDPDKQTGTNYFAAKNKFESTFVADNGVRLRRLINRSTHGELIWEIPKGRKKNKTEQDIHCAIREFHEETHVSKTSYKIFPNNANTYTYVDDGTTYVNKYYLAYTKLNLRVRIEFSSKDQIEEVGDIKWMNMNEIRHIDPKLATFVRPIFNFMRKHHMD